MGLLDGLLGNVLGSAMGGGQQQQGSGNSALLQMAMQILMHKGGGQQGQAGGGLGDILGSVMGGSQPLQQQGSGGGRIGDILGGLMGGGQQAQQGGGMGGLGSLLEAFKKNGMGDQANSWVSTGENMPVSGDQVTSVFGQDQISQMAEQLGMSRGDVSGGLAQMLPQLINHVTPNGQVPQDHNMITDALSALLKR